MAEIHVIYPVCVLLAVCVHSALAGVVHLEPPEEQESPGTLESDMKLTKEQREAIEADISAQASGVDARKAHADLALRWTDGIVPYVISAESQGDSDKIKEALAYWESNTCIRFPEYDANKGHTNRINFIKDVGCWSWVGQTGRLPQDISIGNGCAYRGTIAHELGHAIGFWHEQSREDRDNYVTIHWDNIQSGKSHNFNKYGPETINSYSVPYDIGSLMHYGAW
uniref:Metalloendopeptidase n=1 Tax=Saccoglossus kowalevskii TaxID=10224 RepID=A0ABM0LZB5_SACKO